MNWFSFRDKLIFAPYLRLIDGSIQKDSVLLEVGCGRGNSLFKKIYNKCSRVIGVDLDSIALEENKYVTEKINSSIEEINLKDNSVDIVIATWVFEHIENPDECISNICRVLKKGGSLIFITPNKNSLPSLFSRLTPTFLHSFFCKVLYRRDSDDTFKTFYKLNSLKDIRMYLKDFNENDVIMHDDLKFFGSLFILRPLAYLWNYIIMLKFMKNFRAIIIAKYVKN